MIVLVRLQQSPDFSLDYQSMAIKSIPFLLWFVRQDNMSSRDSCSNCHSKTYRMKDPKGQGTLALIGEMGFLDEASGDLVSLNERMTFNVYRCPKCDHVDFYVSAIRHPSVARNLTQPAVPTFLGESDAFPPDED